MVGDHQRHLRRAAFLFQTATWFILATKRLRILATVAMVNLLRVPIVRVITTPLYIVSVPKAAPGGLCDEGSFVYYGEFCQTPMVRAEGIEPSS